MACQGFAHIKHLMGSAVWHGRFSCGFCSRLGFGDNIERAEQRRSRHLGPGFRGWNFRRPTGCVFFVGNIWMFPKIVVFPPNHPFLIGCSIIFTIHFGGIPLFLETPIWMIGLLWWKTVWDSVDVFLLHPPNGKRKDQWPVAMVRKHGFISRCIFWKGSHILRGIWAGIVCFQLNRVRNQMQELRQKASWWTTYMFLKPPLPFMTPTAGKTCFQCTIDLRHQGVHS